MSIDTVLNNFDWKPFDYLLFHFVYDGGNEEKFYKIDGEEDIHFYELKSTTQQFVSEYTQIEELSTKVLIFQLNYKIEEFAIFQRDAYWIGELHFGELVPTESGY